MIDRYGAFFRSRGHNNAPVAQRYLHGLAQTETATFAAMAAVVEDGCEQQFQHFISNAPWRHEPVIAQIGRDADRLLGGKPDSALILDESSFVKQGDRSVGVARHWCGRLGKVDNCQVAVFAVLTDGARHTPVDMQLYLPQRWIDDPARCDRAEIPVEARMMRSKTELALEIVRAARARGMRFGWVGVDGGYGKEPAFLRALDDMGETSLPMSMARSGSGANRRGCTFHRHSPPEAVHQASNKPPWMASRWRSWSLGSAWTTGSAAPCARARAVRCRSISRTGGSGYGMARKRWRGVGTWSSAAR